jgi:acyl-coenzyme A synthetase/AMP-(fatty) acid ligase
VTGDGAKRTPTAISRLSAVGRVNVAATGSARWRSSALVDHPSVAEAAVVGPHELKGQAIAAFVT